MDHCSTPWCLVDGECNDPLKQKVNLFGDNDNLYISYLPCGNVQPFRRDFETNWERGDYEMCVDSIDDVGLGAIEPEVYTGEVPHDDPNVTGSYV